MVLSEKFDIYSLAATKEFLLKKLNGLIPEFEIHEKAEKVFKINSLKAKGDFIVLGHNYMEPALYHGVADFTGDSLELCRKAQQAQEGTIIFLGVEFMAESAKILNPDRTVLLPSKKAGCSLAASITAADVRALRKKYPGVPVVTYINTYADVKAETDVCCTSSNAADIVRKLKSDRIIFIPDEYLAQNVASETGVDVIFPDMKQPAGATSEKVFIGWRGRCEVHERFTTEDIARVRAQFPDVFVLAHPECSKEVVDAADFSGSTSAMIKEVKKTKANHILLLTECAMGDNIAAELGENSDKLLRLCSIRCPHMAQITLDDTLAAIEKRQYEINVPEEIRVKALRSIDRMLELSNKVPSGD